MSSLQEASAASSDSVILQGGKLSRRPDTPVPISQDSKIGGALSLDDLRLPLNISSNQLSKEEEKQSSQFPSRNSTPSKRRRTSGFGDDLYDLDENRDQSPNDSIKKFACPYFRKDPERHLECLNLKMIRIPDVKQHLKRRHTAPYPCPRCSKGFSSLNLQEEHILQQDCLLGSGANCDSVSLTSQKALQARFKKSLSPEAQWYGIWTILFGERQPMPKPHLDAVVQEVIGILRGKWLDEGQRRISEFVQAQDQPPSYNDQLCQLLAEILDGVEARFEQKPSDRSSRNPPVGLGHGLEESTGVQLVTTSDPTTTGEYSFPTDGSGDWFTPYDTAILSFDFSAAASEVSEISYQESELSSFPGAQLLQAQHPGPNKPVSDHDLFDYSQQQHDSMGGAML
ncbi:hypothetical protein FPANT_1379 [Fusarium pseudoanthophilum]|uniref:C2H2-type domain-containing protein n=1 Tax=Fusarium pseudoanthophilum TaxID=48495 RepID=A0A8H5UZA7_9HYPO|nr:hypothetical protein FPANT_1379 [Fusarium pseudoanthophilum]